MGGVRVNSLCQQGGLFALSVNRHSVFLILWHQTVWVMAHINVCVGHQLRGDIGAALPAGFGGHVCVAVPAAAHRVGVCGSG